MTSPPAGRGLSRTRPRSSGGFSRPELLASTDWVAERYASELAALESRGDQLGLHTHTWRWQKRVGWVRDHDPAWEEHCAEVALQAFETAYGRPCEAHRGSGLKIVARGSYGEAILGSGNKG